jgi:transposase
VRDDRPFGGPDPPAAVYFFSRDSSGDHPEWHLTNYRGILQADTYAGFNALYKADRPLGPITEAACYTNSLRR